MNNKPFSLLKGYSFQFNIDGNEVIAWFSAFTGREKIYVNGDLISSQNNFSTSSTHNFKIDEDKFSTTLDVKSLLRGPLVCTLKKNGSAVKKKKLVFPITSRIPWLYIISVLLFCITIAILWGILMSYIEFSENILYITVFFVLIAAYVFNKKICKILDMNPVIEDEEIV